jgi:uncharacterized protein (TIGR03435 family)
MRVWLLPLLALTLTGQTPSFEVASIRPGNRTNTGSLCNTFKPSQVSVLASAVWPLNAVIEDAYKDEVDLIDFPQWSRTGNWAINVNIPPNTSVDTCRLMLQTFLAERFHMVTGVETREVARYYLKVAKSGLKLKSVDGPPTSPNADYNLDVKDGNVRYIYRGAPMSRILISIRAHAELDARGRSLRDTGVVNDPSFRIAAVVDETGLSGYYDGQFDFAPTASLRNELAESLDDALSRQLGLTLELRRAPGKVLVIRSSVRTPTEN